MRSALCRKIWWVACPSALAALVYTLWGTDALMLLLWQARHQPTLAMRAAPGPCQLTP